MFDKLKKIWSKKNYSAHTTAATNSTTADGLPIDMESLVDLEAQKKVCTRMIEIIYSEDKRLKQDFISIKTIYDVLDSDITLKVDMGEYVGYHYGVINELMNGVSVAIINLLKFSDGTMDAVKHDARGMYITIWYNIAIANISAVEHSVSMLNELEIKMIGIVSQDINAVERGIIH